MGVEVTSKKHIAKEEWKKKLGDVSVRKKDMNELVMRFFLEEGYESAAATFHLESGTHMEIHHKTISMRSAVRQAILSLDLETAMDMLRFHFHKVLENPFVLFCMQRQRLIELIRGGNAAEALTFCQEHVEPLLKHLPPHLRDEVRSLLSLLAYKDPLSSRDRGKLDQSEILGLAILINQAILRSCGHAARDPKLAFLIKRLIRVQYDLLELATTFPYMEIPSCCFLDPITGERDSC